MADSQQFRRCTAIVSGRVCSTVNVDIFTLQPQGMADLVTGQTITVILSSVSNIQNG